MSEVLSIDQICHLLSHRYPFLLIDHVLELDRGNRVVANGVLVFTLGKKGVDQV